MKRDTREPASSSGTRRLGIRLASRHWRGAVRIGAVHGQDTATSPGTSAPAYPPPSAPRNRATIGAATVPPDSPCSTSAATARSPRNAMNHACVGGGSPEPNSAVPLLPATSPGSAASAEPVPDTTTLRISDRSLRRSASPSGRPARVGAHERGARQRLGDRRRRPRPWPAGVARMRSWPIIAAARSTRVRPGGTWLGATSSGSVTSRSRPKSSAALASASAGSSAGERHERGVAGLREVLREQDGARRLALEVAKRLPSTVRDAGHRTVLSGSEPVAQQRGGADDLERRAGRIAAAERAVEGHLRRPVRDGEDVAGRRLDRHERGLVVAVAERALGRALHVERKRGAQRPAGPPAVRGQRFVRGAVREAGDHTLRRRPGQAALEARLEPELSDLRTRPVRGAEPVELLGGGRADGTEQRPGEPARRRQWRLAVDRLHAADAPGSYIGAYWQRLYALRCCFMCDSAEMVHVRLASTRCAP